MIPFTKMHGLGNNYIYVDTHQHPLPEKSLSELARNVSCPFTGIGSDGLILIGPSKKASVSMRIFNKDGSEAGNCGNGLRCVAKYAYEKGLVSHKKMTIETRNTIVSAEIKKHNTAETIVCVDMGPPRLERHSIPMQGKNTPQIVDEPFLIDGHKLALTAVSMGNPHAVFFVTSAKNNLHTTIGPKIEKDTRFPEGVNVEFVYASSPTSLQCTVWERGSGPTQACGTGACAAAVAAVLNKISPANRWITVQLAGGVLDILWDNHVFMSGPAVTVATGFFHTR